MFKNPFFFSGRITRTEFCISAIIYWFATGSLSLVIQSGNIHPILAFLIFYIPLGWFLCEKGTKRCHDRGNVCWYQLIPGYFIWMMFAKGEIGPNEYGLNPKE